MFCKKLYIYIYIYSKNQIKGEDCCKLCCCCCSVCNKNNKPKLNNDIYIEKNRHFDTEKDNNNQINDFGGIKGIIGKLEDNKVIFNINTDSGLKKIAETVEEYNGDFNYENVKNLKVKLLDVDVAPDTIEKTIECFDCSNNLTNSFSFLGNKTKVVTYLNDEISEEIVYNLNDNRVYKGIIFTNVGPILLNVDKEYKELKYGVNKNGIYVKKTADDYFSFDYDPEKQEEYKKCFFEGK